MDQKNHNLTMHCLEEVHNQTQKNFTFERDANILKYQQHKSYNIQICNKYVIPHHQQ